MDQGGYERPIRRRGPNEVRMKYMKRRRMGLGMENRKRRKYQGGVNREIKTREEIKDMVDVFLDIEHVQLFPSLTATVFSESTAS